MFSIVISEISTSSLLCSHRFKKVWREGRGERRGGERSEGGKGGGGREEVREGGGGKEVERGVKVLMTSISTVRKTSCV